MNINESTLAAKWNEYAACVIPLDAPEVQRVETKRAFYAGASAMWNFMSLVSANDISEDEGVNMLSGFEQELVHFAEQVVKGED